MLNLAQEHQTSIGTHFRTIGIEQISFVPLTVRSFSRPDSIIAMVSNRVLHRTKCGLSVFSRRARRYPSILKGVLAGTLL